MSQDTSSNDVASSDGAASTSKIKLILIGLIVAIILSAILYGIGLSKGRAQLASQKSDYETQIQTLQAQLSTSKQESTAAQDNIRLIQARAILYRTALDLERRNFGIANTHLQESAAMLAGVGQVTARKMEGLADLQKAIAKTDINVAVDLESQREQVLDFVNQLESMTPASMPSASMPSVTDSVN